MKIKTQKRWTMAGVFGLVYWFFGNLYEAIVFSPNWVIDSPHQMKRLNEFFVNTNPTIYFVPLTQIATILVWILLWKNKEPSINRELKIGSIFAALATLLNGIIVLTTVLKLFGINYATYGEYLTTLTWRWNILNIFRMAFVALSVYYLFNAYRKLDKLEIPLQQ